MCLGNLICNRREKGYHTFAAFAATLWESWLGDMTGLKQEAEWNKSVKAEEGEETLDVYGNLMMMAFGEM